MKNFKIIAVTAILTGGLFIAGSAHAVLIACGTTCQTTTPVQTAPQSMNQLYDSEQASLQSTNLSTGSNLSDEQLIVNLQTQLATDEQRITSLEARVSALEGKALTTTTSTCLSVSDQIAKGYVYNICNGQKL